MQREIFDLISRLVDRLRSPDIAIDERHTPALHSRFLHGLLRKHRHLAVSSHSSDSQGPSSQPPAQNVHGSSMSSSSSSTSASAFQQQSLGQQQPSGQASQGAPQGQYATHAGGAVFDNVAATSPTSFTSSDSSTTFPTSDSMFDVEPSYTTVTGHDMFQFAPPQDTSEVSLGALAALANPNYWKDMMMPGYVADLHELVCGAWC